MKKLLTIIVMIALCNCTSQKNVSPGKSDTTVVISGSTTDSSNKNETKSATPTKTVILNNPSSETRAANTTGTSDKTVTTSSASNKKGGAIQGGNNNLPGCINKMIDQFRQDAVQNPPRKIYSFTYKGNTVYYVTPPCCDFFSDLYDKDCKLIAHPDGGITGKGDGRLKDFSDLRTNEKLVWEDTRKYR